MDVYDLKMKYQIPKFKEYVNKLFKEAGRCGSKKEAS